MQNSKITLTEYISNKELLLTALTHRSWVNENIGVRGTNERLEFLGDAILEFVVSDRLFTLFPDKEEGYLTALRSNLVNTKNLSDLARRIDLGKQIFLSKGEEEGGGRENSSLLADTVEAIIGAIFLDVGIEGAYKFIDNLLLHDVETRSKLPLKDPKSLLQEYVQSKKLPAPKYVVVSETGPDHLKSFIIEVIVDHQSLARGTGKSKAEAEQNAAAIALDVVPKVG